MRETWNNCLALSLGNKVLERKVMQEQSMAIMKLKKAVINHETSPAPTHWPRFGDCRNQLVAKYIGNVVMYVHSKLHQVVPRLGLKLTLM